MKYFLRIAAYIFHPLLMPLLGGVMYYMVTPRFVEPEIVQAKLFAIAIITLFIPIVMFFLLKNLGVVETIHLKMGKERKFPLMIQCILLLLILKMVFDPFENPEMYYFFVAILFSTIAALILIFFKVRISLHQMGIAGVTMFLIALSVHFKVNLLLGVSVLIFINGWVASSRLYSESHSQVELFLGLIFGLVPQLVVLNMWI